MLCTATIPAVSVRNLLLPNETGTKLLDKANEISVNEKSPSGPIKIIVFPFFF